MPPLNSAKTGRRRNEPGAAPLSPRAPNSGDHAYVDVPWRANARLLAAEANDDKLFAGKIDWPLASLIAREMVGETWQ